MWDSGRSEAAWMSSTLWESSQYPIEIWFLRVLFYASLYSTETLSQLKQPEMSGKRSLALHTLKVCFDGCFFSAFCARDVQTVNHPEWAVSILLLTLKTSLRCFFLSFFKGSATQVAHTPRQTQPLKKGHVSRYTSDECECVRSIFVKSSKRLSSGYLLAEHSNPDSI